MIHLSEFTNPTYLRKQNRRIREQILRDPALSCVLFPIFFSSFLIFICMCTHSQISPSYFIPRQASRKSSQSPGAQFASFMLQCLCFLPSDFVLLGTQGLHQPPWY